MSQPISIIDERRLKAKSFASVPQDVELKAMPDGLAVGDWRQALIMQGFGGLVNIGGFSTPIVGGGNGTVLDLDQPEGVLSIPKGWTLIPLRFSVQCQLPLLAADNDESEILITVDADSTWFRDGTKTDETVFNLRNGKGHGGSPIIAASAFTADCTVDGTNDFVHDYDLAHAVKVGDVQGTAANAMWNDLVLDYAPAFPPLIDGPATVIVYWGGTVATSGFAQLTFLAVPTDKFAGMGF